MRTVQVERRPTASFNCLILGLYSMPYFGTNVMQHIQNKRNDSLLTKLFKEASKNFWGHIYL